MAQSRGEMKIEDVLKNNSINYFREYIFADLISSSGKPLRFDFAVFDDDGNLDFLIEYQGEQHYTSVSYFGGAKGLHRQKYNDNKKVRYCLNKKYPLLVIPYWDYDKLDYNYIFSKVEKIRY